MNEHLRLLALLLGLAASSYAASVIELNVRVNDGGNPNPIVSMLFWFLGVVLIVPAVIFEGVRIKFAPKGIHALYMFAIGASYIPVVVFYYMCRAIPFIEIPLYVSIPALAFNPLLLYLAYYQFSKMHNKSNHADRF